MPRGNVEVFRRVYEVFNDEGFDDVAEFDLRDFDPDVVMDNSNAALDGAVYRGHDGLRAFLLLLRTIWHRQRGGIAHAKAFPSKGETFEAVGLGE